MARNTDNDLPTDTVSWHSELINRFGIRKAWKTNPFDLVFDEWSLFILRDGDISRIDDIVEDCSFPEIDFESLEDISLENFKRRFKDDFFENWRTRWFPSKSIAELPFFNANCKRFALALYFIIEEMHQEEREKQPIDTRKYQLLFERFLELFEIATMAQPVLSRKEAVIFGKGITSKADILCFQNKNPKKLLSVCTYCKAKRKRNHHHSEDLELSSVNKQLRPAAASASEEVPGSQPLSSALEERPGSRSSSPALKYLKVSHVHPESYNLPPNVSAQHIGDLLVYLDSSVSRKGILGMVIQGTNALDVTPQQQKWIVDHMVHTLDVHDIHYRCTSDIIERGDIAKLLLLMDMKQVGYFKNKKLEEISLEELVDEPAETQGHDVPDQSPLLPLVDTPQTEEEYIPNLLEEEQEEEEILFDPHVKKRRKHPTCSRHKWTTAEILEVQTIFKKYFENDQTPGIKAYITRALRRRNSHRRRRKIS